MRKVKKESRVEHEVVCITEWRGVDGARKWLLVKRPENGELVMDELWCDVRATVVHASWVVHLSSGGTKTCLCAASELR